MCDPPGWRRRWVRTTLAPMFGPIESLPLGGVLVGGQSRRFGSDKAVAHVGGRSMASLAVQALRQVSDPVVLLGGDGTLAKRMALPSREDARPGCGPLSGVAAGLRWAAELERFGLLVLACDLPLVSATLLKEICALATSEVDAVVPESATEGTQPLCAWYGPGALPTIEARLEGGDYAMRGLLTHLRVAYVPFPDDILNVNTLDDLAVARSHLPTESLG